MICMNRANDYVYPDYFITGQIWLTGGLIFTIIGIRSKSRAPIIPPWKEVSCEHRAEDVHSG